MYKVSSQLSSAVDCSLLYIEKYMEKFRTERKNAISISMSQLVWCLLTSGVHNNLCGYQILKAMFITQFL